jgi:DNA-binding transcriptional regulator YiaG
MTTIATSAQFREARHKLGLSVKAAGILCGVNERTIRRWETGSGRGDGRDPHPSACKLLEIELSKPKAR